MRTSSLVPPADIVWYRTPPGAPVYGKPTAFRSRNWVYTPENEGIGEQSGPKECGVRCEIEWYNSKVPTGLITGPNPCGTDTVARYGGGPTDPLFLTNPDGSAPCCEPPPPGVPCGPCVSIPFTLPITLDGWGGRITGTATWVSATSRWEYNLTGVWNPLVGLGLWAVTGSIECSGGAISVRTANITFRLPFVGYRGLSPSARGIYIESFGLVQLSAGGGSVLSEVIFGRGPTTVTAAACVPPQWKWLFTPASPPPSTTNIYELPSNAFGLVNGAVMTFGSSPGPDPTTTLPTGAVFELEVVGLVSPCDSINGVYTLSHYHGGFVWTDPQGAIDFWGLNSAVLVVSQLPDVYLQFRGKSYRAVGTGVPIGIPVPLELVYQQPNGSTCAVTSPATIVLTRVS